MVMVMVVVVTNGSQHPASAKPVIAMGHVPATRVMVVMVVVMVVVLRLDQLRACGLALRICQSQPL
jgi:hypothetical protein